MTTGDYRPLYPVTEPFDRGWLEVGEGHRILVRQFGRIDGLPAVLVHGGPGSGHSQLLPRFLDPARYRIICPDQRGSGLSEPRGGVDHNDTDRLVADLRQVRRHLGIDRWLVFGGSWGATLGLCHAADEPQAVTGLLLRGSFLARAEDIDWFFQGARAVRPRHWALFAATAPAAWRDNLLGWYGPAILQGDAATALQAARAWWQWELALTRPADEDRQAPAPAGPGPSPAPPSSGDEAGRALVDRYRIQAHYLLHGCWLAPPRDLLARCATLPQVATLVVHGDDDVICRPEGAELLMGHLPDGSRFERVEGAGHDPTHRAITDLMVRATDAFARAGRFD